MSELRPGLVGEEEIIVTAETATKHTGATAMLTTPALVYLMENASINCTQPYLPPGHTTVGYEIHVKHLAPTPVGMRVRARSELVAVDGRKLEFHIEAYDERQKIGEATHRRAIVDLAQFKAGGKD